MFFATLKRDTCLYGLSTLLVRGIQIFLIPVYTRVLGANEYGVIETVAIIGALVNLTVAMEIGQGMARYVADAAGELAIKSFATTALGFSAMAYSIFLLLVIVFSSSLISLLFNGLIVDSVLVLAATAIAVNGVYVILQDLLRWKLRPYSYVIAAVTYALTSTGVGIWLVVFERMGITGVFWSQLAAATMGTVVSLSRAQGLLGMCFDNARLRIMLRFSLPLVLSGAAVFCNLFIDRIVVRDQLGLQALGVYGVAARFASTISILAIGLQAALSPIVYRHWREPGTGDTIGRICRYYCAGMVLLVGFISLFSPEIMNLFAGTDYYAGRKVLPLLTLGAMFSTLYVFAPGLFLGERTDRVALINIAGAVINLILALTLTPWLNLSGAALAATIAPAIVFAGYLFLGRTWFTVNYMGFRLAGSLGVMLLLVITSIFLQTAPFPETSITILVKSVLLIIAGIVTYLFALDRADRKAIRQKAFGHSSTPVSL